MSCSASGHRGGMGPQAGGSTGWRLQQLHPRTGSPAWPWIHQNPASLSPFPTQAAARVSPLTLSSIRREPQGGSRQGWLSPASLELSRGYPRPTIPEDGAMPRICPIPEQPPPSPTGWEGPTPWKTSPVPAASPPAGSVQDLLQLVLLAELAGEGQAGEVLHPAPVHGVHVQPHHQRGLPRKL